MNRSRTLTVASAALVPLVAAATFAVTRASDHAAAIPDFMLPLRDGGEAAWAVGLTLLERAIGVIYRPETERLSHYFHADLARQFDAVLHFDRTRAV